MNKLGIIFIALLVAVNIYLGSQLLIINKKESSVKHAIAEPPVSSTAMKQNIISSFENDNIRLNNVRVYSGSDTTKVRAIFDYIKENTLIFRFSGNYCEECILSVIEKIKKNFTNYSTNPRIILICSDVNARLKDNYYEKQLTSYADIQDMGLSLEKAGIPFLFVVGKDRISKMVFMPELSEQELTDNYIKTIKYKFFTN